MTGPFTLPPLPYDASALAPTISAVTLDIHHGRHHQAYLDNLNRLVVGTPHEAQSLDEIVRAAAAGEAALFNNAAQAWNHDLYWRSLTPRRTQADAQLAAAIERDFGGLPAALHALKTAATGQFGSGWAWLSAENGLLRVEATGNADTPHAHGRSCLLTIDVWEHAYYLDVQNRRAAYVEAVLDLLDWDGASARYAQALDSARP